MAQATYDDANLILRLYELRREEKLRNARAWFVGNFRAKTMAEFATICPPGSETDAQARMVASYWDMVASFITSGVLNETLFFQSGRELLLVWVRMRSIVEDGRKAFNDPNVWKNLETVGKRFADYLGPEAFAAFEKRVG